MKASHPLEMLAKTVGALGPLVDEMVFVGGTVAAALITDDVATGVRATEDVDAVVNVQRLPEYYKIQERLAECGFYPDPAGPICRFVKDDLKIDVMPTEISVLGFTNRFYAEAFEHAQSVSLPGGAMAKLVTAPFFIAMKLDAFWARGEQDYLSCRDLEDIIAVIDGRDQVVKECAQVPSNRVATYLSEKMTVLLESDDFLEALPGHLAGDPGSQARASIILGRMRKIRDQRRILESQV